MAISYVLGNPGSGKTYYAVYEIYKYFFPNKEINKQLKFKNDKENLIKYDFCYTNINEFKFEDFDNVKKLDFEDLKFHLTNLYNYKVDDDKEDNFLINYCKENNIFNSLFVVDEIHNYFNKSDKVLIWWLTYHRHLSHDLILITQNLSLVANEYKQIAEFFYKAVDGGKRLFSNKLKYIRFSDYRMYNNSIVEGGGKSLKLYPFIYNLYHSGAESKSKSFVKVYIIFGFLFLVLAVGLFFYSLNSFSPKKNTSSNSKNSKFQSSKYLTNSNDLNNSNNLIDNISYNFDILCIKNYCYLSSNYYIYSSIPVSYLFYLFKNNKFIYKTKQNTFKNTVKYFIVSDKDIFKNFIIKRKVSNEKNNINDDFNSYDRDSKSSS